MIEKCKSFEELTSGAADFLLNKLLRSKETIRHYHCLWRRIKSYMLFNQIECFNSTVGKQYLLKEFGDRDYCKLLKSEKDLIKAVNVLCEFQAIKSIQPVKEQTIFEGEIGHLMTKFISHKLSLRLHKHTINEHEQHLYRFLIYLNENGITFIKAISQLHIFSFIKSINHCYTTLVHLTISTLRGFFKYLYEQDLLNIDISSFLPKDNFKRQAKLPSTYSEKEIEILIASIDRGNANGKRNYAITLLAARLGLRASDIANLKFENIFWEPCSIVLNQYKTGRKIELPLLPEIGNAIIDYLKYGRPKSKEEFVFLLSRSPYTPIHSFGITGIVHSAFLMAGINIENRKHGPHALRHSLAGILLEKETTVPIISEVLGHKNIESTRYYLRIDLKSMRQCVLDVPMVSPFFYEQKGGYFYA